MHVQVSLSTYQHNLHTKPQAQLALNRACGKEATSISRSLCLRSGHSDRAALAAKGSIIRLYTPSTVGVCVKVSLLPQKNTRAQTYRPTRQSAGRIHALLEQKHYQR